MKSSKKFSFLCISVLLIGCTNTSGKYGASPRNVEAIRSSIGAINVSVGDFSSDSGEETTFFCRGAGPVKLQNGQSFQDYIEKAFINDLKLAGVYSEKSGLQISALIQELGFNSMPGAGKWVINASVSSSVSEGFLVESTYEFSTNFVAWKACQQVAQEFEPAVEEFINSVVTHPKFPALFK
jgi:hypothetical protein